jgi:hypothetical protein
MALFANTWVVGLVLKVARLVTKFVKGISVKYKIDTEKQVLGIFKDNKLLFTITFDFIPDEEDIMLFEEGKNING